MVHAGLIAPPLAPSLADEQREVAQKRIMRAAGAVLAARGLAATIDDVAEAAGVSRRTIFRHFATRDALFVAVIRAGVRRYAEQIPEPPADDDLRDWLAELLAVTHRLNAGNGRVFWDLVGPRAREQSAELAVVAEECRDSRNRFAVTVTELMWRARGGSGRPPRWLVDVVAVQLSGFTTQSLGGDLGRSPDEVALVSARVIEAALAQCRLVARR